MRFFIKNIFIILVALIVLTGTAFAAGNINSVQKYSQFLDSQIDLDNNGTKDFINWSPTNGGATVSDTDLSGYIWGESVGWINLHPTNIWVSNSCDTGILGGYAWGENTGWINFDPSTATGSNHPQIDTATGKITGKAWSQNYGWINLSSPQTPPTTSYNPSLGLVTSWTPSQGGGGGAGGVCGSLNNQSLTVTPSGGGLCASGTASAVVSVTGGWIWTCAPASCGTTASCGASQKIITTGSGQVLSITKYVVNAHGGTATNTDFTIKATNTATHITTSHTSGIGVQYSLAAGNYVVAEDPTPGYTAVYGGDCDADGNVTLPVDTNKSCTVTNYDGPPPPPPVDYCLNIKMSLADAIAQGYTLTYNTNPTGYNCLKTNPPLQYCLNIPGLLVSDAVATGYYTVPQSTGYDCMKDSTPSTYCTNNNSLTLHDAQNQGYTIDSVGNCIKSGGTICHNLGPNFTILPFGYHFAANGDCVPDSVDYCPLMNGIQTSPSDCPNLFDSPNTTLGTFLNGLVGGGGGWLKWLLTALAALGLAGSLPGAISRLGNEILTLAFGRKKWRGIVYDSNTKEPLDPVYVSVIDVVTGLEVANQFTDFEGRFGFVLKPGKYKIVAGKTNYLFPSAKLAGRYSDEAYDHLYFGEIFTVEKDDQVVTMNIPMDPTGTDWNQQEKHRNNFWHYFMRGQTRYVWFWNMLTVIGFLASIMITYFYPVWWNYVMTALYVVLAIFYAYGGWPIAAGKITKGGAPLAYAIVKAYNVALNHEVAHRITSSSGAYYLLLPKGEYMITIEERNADGTYTKVFASGMIKARGGLINKSFKL